MAQKKAKIRTITIKQEQGTFSAIFGRFMGDRGSETSNISMLRSVLSNEKARLLHVLKTKQPNSIYELAKILGRDFKSVRQDIRVLENFGLIEMIPIHKGNREMLKPLLVLDELKINLEL